MPAAAIVTLIGAGLTIAVLAAYLLRVAWLLQHVSSTLGDVVAGLEAIAQATDPLEPVVEEIHGDLVALTRALDQLVGEGPDARIEAGVPPQGSRT